MKITCQSCQAKYTIADEKVVGKTVKIKCKKCGATIVVNGNEVAPAAAPASPVYPGRLPMDEEGATRVFSGPEPGAAPGADEWTVNVSDEDQRTMTSAQLAQAYAAGTISGETYVWRDGMGDWLPLSSVPELASAVSRPGPAAGAGYGAPASYPPPGDADEGAHDNASTVAFAVSPFHQPGAQAAYAAALAHAQAHGAYAAQPHAGFLEDRPSQVGFAETSSNQLDEDALEEVEFFASHGMFDEARGLLESELARLPRHPLLLERMRELDAMAADAAGAEDPYRAAEHAREQGDDRSFDIAASLDMLDAIDAGPVAHGSGGGEADPHQVSVESVFEQFKAGVAAQVAESDAATHYDLGVAYQEMGLLHDAINEFHLAAREPERECVCQSMVGMIHLSLGDVDAAIDSFIRGLHASHRTIDQELALTYEIGNAYEAQGVADQAVYYFQRAAHIDPGYDDPRGSAVDRIQRIEPMHAEGRGATPQGPSFDGDDFAGLLDDKLP